MLLANRRSVASIGTARINRRHKLVCHAGRDPTEPHIQLATATLPRNTDSKAFVSYLFQWANTMTSSGANYPFVLPLKTEKTADNGFQISLLNTMPDRRLMVSADIVSTVEAEDDKTVLFVRFYEGPGGVASRGGSASGDAKQRLNTLLDSLVDVPIIMQTMPKAIRQAVQIANTA